MKESRTLEFKETVTNTFLKTVSAFANYGTGEIIFGITDDGKISGIQDPERVCLDACHTRGPADGSEELYRREGSYEFTDYLARTLLLYTERRRIFRCSGSL